MKHSNSIEKIENIEKKLKEAGLPNLKGYCVGALTLGAKPSDLCNWLRLAALLIEEEFSK